MDVAIIGGGIVGVAAAAFLAEGGAEVALAEQNQLGAGASGRNSGAVQHPFDPVLEPLYEETLAIYRELEADGTAAFPLDRPPDGLLSVAPHPAPLESFAADARRAFPALDPQLVEPSELGALEPALAPGLYACRTETAWAVPPAASSSASTKPGPPSESGALSTVQAGAAARTPTAIASAARLAVRLPLSSCGATRTRSGRALM